jgi:hypothetical protein
LASWARTQLAGCRLLLLSPSLVVGADIDTGAGADTLRTHTHTHPQRRPLALGHRRAHRRSEIGPE